MNKRGHKIVVSFFVVLATLVYVVYPIGSPWNNLDAKAGWFNSDYSWTYKQALTVTNNVSEETDAMIHLSEGELVRLDMEDGSGTTASDISGNGLDAAISGLGSGISWTSSGRYNEGLAYDGTTGVYSSIYDLSGIDSGIFSLSLWFKTSSSSTMPLIIREDPGSGWGYYLKLNNGELEAYTHTPGTGDAVNFITSSSSLDDNSWHMATWVVDSGSMLSWIYVDGAAADIEAITNSCGTVQNSDTIDIYGCDTGFDYFASDFSIGGQLNFGSSFNGTFDELRVYTRVLSSTEINFLYNNNMSPLLGQTGVYDATQADGDDIRFTEDDGSTELTYRTIIYTSAGQNADIWIQVPTLPGGDTTLYFYYGKSDATSNSDGNLALPSPGGESTAESLTVSGAGDGQFNGSYTANGTYAGHTTYTNGTMVFCYEGGGWTMMDFCGGAYIAYTGSGDLPANPWSAVMAPPSAPTVDYTPASEGSPADPYWIAELDGDPITYEPNFTFTVEGVASSTTQNGVTSNITTDYDEIPYGKLEMGIPKFGLQKLTVSTNAMNGYTVTVKLDGYIQGLNPANKIDPFGATNVSWTTPQNWSTPNGTEQNTDTGWFGANTSDTRVSGWESASGKFGPISSTAHTVMSGPDMDSSATAYVGYAIEVESFQPSDSYAGTLIYSAVPQY